MIRLVAFLVLAAVLLTLVLIGIPAIASHAFGPPARALRSWQIVQYSARLLWDDGLLTKPLEPAAPPIAFTVQTGESVASVCSRLKDAGIVGDASALRDYLVYTGLDTSVQVGTYEVGPGMSIIDIARAMQDATPAEVTFVVLPGWRIEEVAASLPTSGLSITPQEFVAAASLSPGGFEYLSGATTHEGFLYPDSYIVPRDTKVDQLLNVLVRNFALHLNVDIQEGFSRQKLTVYQAVTVASIVQREAVQTAEAPIIASVYLNRLRTGMRLDADPTVQYAVGYNVAQDTWWTNPLGLADLQQASEFNTYVINGLPPTPIDSPGMSSLQAVASPADSPYYYFSARCDGSGYHNFAQSFEEHLRNICP